MENLWDNEFEKENDDTLEENYMTVYMKMSNGKTISRKYNRNWTAAVILDEVERRSSQRHLNRCFCFDVVFLHRFLFTQHFPFVHQTYHVTRDRLLGGMEMNEQMNIHETEEDREKKRKLDEGKEGKAMKSNDDMICMKRDIMEALKRSDEKNRKLLKKD